MGEPDVADKTEPAAHVVFVQGKTAAAQGVLQQSQYADNRRTGEKPFLKDTHFFGGKHPGSAVHFGATRRLLQFAAARGQAIAGIVPIQLRHTARANRFDAAAGVPGPFLADFPAVRAEGIDAAHQVVVGNPLGGQQLHRIPHGGEIGSILDPAVIAHQPARASIAYGIPGHIHTSFLKIRMYW